MRTIEAIIDSNGEVRLNESVQLSVPRRALVTILDEPPTTHFPIAQRPVALAEDWNRAEEDAAWAHLQPDKSS